MPYYRGDGNYYRGDPFLGALVGGLVGKAGKWLVKRVTGSRVGQKIDRVAESLPGIGVVGGSLLPSLSPINLGPVTVNPGAILPGGKPFISVAGKKYRRMNPLNPKALRRALRRAEGFEKFARRTVNALFTTRDGRRVKKFKRKTPTR